LGLKGQRPEVGTWDNKDKVYVFGACNLQTGQIHTRFLKCPKGATKTTGKSQNRRLQETFVTFIKALARTYPENCHKPVVIIIDNAPWHAGLAVTQVLASYPHISFYRLPSYSPKLNPIERFWKILRRRATHNRLFSNIDALCATLRNNFKYFRSIRHKLLSMLDAKHPLLRHTPKFLPSTCSLNSLPQDLLLDAA
jgi:transposase